MSLNNVFGCCEDLIKSDCNSKPHCSGPMGDAGGVQDRSQCQTRFAALYHAKLILRFRPKPYFQNGVIS